MTDPKPQKLLDVEPEQSSDETDNNTPPDLWDSFFEGLPIWGDEVAALTLIIFGILSFLSLFGIAGEAYIPLTWARTLNSLFGYGSLIVSGGMLALGVALILPNIGIEIRFPIQRIIALELAFLSTLALLHLIASRNIEARALARVGEGGGLVGWALSSPLSQLIGSTTVLIFYVLMLIASIGVVIGIRRQQIKKTLKQVQLTFYTLGTRLEERPAQNRKRRQRERERRAAAERYLLKRYSEQESPRTPLIRIRPNLENIPPSLRPGAAPEPEAAPTPEETSHPLFEGAVQGENFNIIGEVLPDPDKKSGGVKSVRRPDGRVKKYFSLSDFDEQKKVGRRKKDFPALELLEDIPLNHPDESEINTKVVLIENTLLEFDVDIDVVSVRIGPTVTQYAIKPYKETDNERTQHTRISKIASYQSDLALALSVKRLRIEAPVPGTNYVGIEVPNSNPSVVALRSVYESKAFYDKLQNAKTPLLIPLGRDVAGVPFIIDLATMPHTLVAGTTGSGKSVCLAATIVALVLHNTPDDLRLVLLDPKMVELSRFNGLPHLLGNVETDAERILGVLRWCTREMDSRYRTLETAGTRNISIYNEREREKGTKGEPLPYIVIMIDEVGDLMMTNPDETEHHLTRLAQMARAVGMHMIIATQRPSVDVLTGLIKANFPGRIAFSVASQVDSRVIIDASGAESLLGKGDMLFMSSDASGPRRLQGCFVDDDEVRAIVKHWQAWASERREQGKLEEVTQPPWEKTLSKLELLSETDDLLEQALEAVVRAREASATMLQRHLNIGFPRASRIMDLLFELGAIGPPEPGGKTRKVLISSTRKDPMGDLIQRQQDEQRRAARMAAAQARRAAQPSDAAEYADEDDDLEGDYADLDEDEDDAL